MQLTHKYLLFIFPSILLAFIGFANEKNLHGRVIDKNGAGIAGAVFEAEDRKELFYCNNKGYFNFTFNADSIDAFMAGSPGYDKKEIITNELTGDSLTVELEKTNTYLKGTTVKASGGTMREEVAGISKGGHNAGCYFEFKDEIAIFLSADSLKHGTLKEIGAYITKDGAKDTKFVMHVYNRDSATGGPGEDITDTILALQARRGNEWVTADLSDKLIQVKGGLFISVEWTLTYVSNYFVFETKGAPNYYAGDDSFRTVYNGQVLGLAWGDDKRPLVYRKYANNIYSHKDPDTWFRTPPLRGGRRYREWITPMIYYTYTYFEK